MTRNRDRSDPERHDVRARARDRDRERGTRDVAPRERPGRPAPTPTLDALDGRRSPVVFQRMQYHLRETDVQLLRTVGTFRVIYAEHLRDGHPHIDRDVRTLREQGLLIAVRVQHPDTREPQQVLTLTRTGRDLIQGAERGPQRYYADVVKPRELHHDAQLYALYRQYANELAARGAHVEQIRLDHELKHALWTRGDEDHTAADRAQALGLPIDDRGRAHLPDLQVVVREPDGSLARYHLELVTRHYSAEAIRVKTDAGFVCGGPVEDRDIASWLVTP